MPGTKRGERGREGGKEEGECTRARRTKGGGGGEGKERNGGATGPADRNRPQCRKARRTGGGKDNGWGKGGTRKREKKQAKCERETGAGKKRRGRRTEANELERWRATTTAAISARQAGPHESGHRRRFSYKAATSPFVPASVSPICCECAGQWCVLLLRGWCTCSSSWRASC